MEIKVLGPGCANCHKMEEMAKTAVKELGIDANDRKDHGHRPDRHAWHSRQHPA